MTDIDAHTHARMPRKRLILAVRDLKPRETGEISSDSVYVDNTDRIWVDKQATVTLGSTRGVVVTRRVDGLLELDLRNTGAKWSPSTTEAPPQSVFKWEPIYKVWP